MLMYTMDEIARDQKKVKDSKYALEKLVAQKIHSLAAQQEAEKEYEELKQGFSFKYSIAEFKTYFQPLFGNDAALGCQIA